MVWLQDVILGGANRQRVAYDKLLLTQFVQGFAQIEWMSRMKALESEC